MLQILVIRIIVVLVLISYVRFLFRSLSSLKKKKKKVTNFTWFGIVPTVRSKTAQTFTIIEIGLNRRVFRVFIITIYMTNLQKYSTPAFARSF